MWTAIPHVDRAIRVPAMVVRHAVRVRDSPQLQFCCAGAIVIIFIIFAHAARRRSITTSESSIAPSIFSGPRILVCLVGRDLESIVDIAKVYYRRAKRPQGVQFALVVAVSSAREVLPSEQTDAVLDGLPATATWRHSATPSHFLMQGRKIAIQHMYQSETFILLAYGCVPLQDWDELSLRLMQSSASKTRSPPTVLTAVPSSDDEDARFPRLSIPRNGTQIHVKSRSFSVQQPARCASTLCTRNFAFFLAHTLRRLPLEDGQLKQTFRIREMGARIYVPRVPLCVNASRLGVRAEPSGGDISINRFTFGEYPSLGIVRASDDVELIAKYGSIDAARVYISRLKSKRYA